MEAQSDERPPKWKAIVSTSVTIATKMSVLKKYPKDSLSASFSNRGSGHIGKGPIPRGCTVCVFFFVPKKNSSAINHNWIKLKYLPRLPPGFGAFVGAEPTPIKQRIKLRTKFRRFYRRTWLLCTSFHKPISVNLT